MREKEEEKEGKEKEEKDARERKGNHGKVKKEGEGNTFRCSKAFFRCSNPAKRGSRAEPWPQVPPGCLTRALSLCENRRRGGQPGGSHARKK